MKSVNWKEVSQSAGYKTLKEAYIFDVSEAAREKRAGRRPRRDKQEIYQHFQWVICRAIHYADYKGKSVSDILTEWESARRYWWINYYQDCNQPKLHSGGKKPIGLNGLRKYYRKAYRNDPARLKHRVMEEIQRVQKISSTKKKARWTMARKKRAY